VFDNFDKIIMAIGIIAVIVFILVIV